MEHTKLIEYLNKQIEFEDRQLADMDVCSWPLEKGILISGNDAKLIVSTHQKLVDALWKIANGAAPYNQQQLESWRETAIQIAQETLNEITK